MLIPYQPNRSPYQRPDERVREQSSEVGVRICRLHRRLRKYMQVRDHIRHGGPTWRRAEYCGGGRVWVIRFWKETFALLIPLVMATRHR